ncbi:EamA family transporter [Streptomyces tubbatahanensis]|uniref:EamA family transporter n=1 Tax=Streptomyces tubbatahanensis TaxID=2923272 RepID=A0ABY3XSC0_9ACTN|nr:EamA family transporter [Streptomyces tubbatahanensis]UNS97295.1 EamA family transporter [Streptomyces tubbatahanensis]
MTSTAPDPATAASTSVPPAASASPAPSMTATTSVTAAGPETTTGPEASAVRVHVGGSTGRGSLTGVGLVLAGTLSVQFGSAFAALLFPRAGALGTVALRIALAAVLLLLVTRPRLRGYTRADWSVVAGFGLALGGMNMLFYQAIDRIPLGPAVTLEVLGPLLLSAVTSRRAAGLLWAGLALAGVYLLGSGGFDQLTLPGIAFALGAGAMWAAYILLNARAGARFPRLDGLAIAMSVAALVSLPLGLTSTGTTLLEPGVLALGLAIAVMSSGVPYTLELLALRRLPAATFAVLTSLAPAVAALAGYLVLHQGLSALQCAAIAMVVAASAGAVRTGRR